MKRIHALLTAATLVFAPGCSCQMRFKSGDPESDPKTKEVEVAIVRMTRDILFKNKQDFRDLHVSYGVSSGIHRATVGEYDWNTMTETRYAYGVGATKDEALEDLKKHITELAEEK